MIAIRSWCSSLFLGLGFVAVTTAAAPVVPSAPAIAPPLEGINDWVYVLQAAPGATLADLAATSFDAAVIDYSSDGSGAGEYTAAEIASLRASGKIVLAYISIGEAEDYRWYWNPAWNDQGPPDPDAPAWLGPFNPSFPNNYKVRYWDPAWQTILFGVANGPQKSYLDRVLDQGFDGVYLDIIDAFDFWSVDVPERTRDQARADMIGLVEGLASYARCGRGVSGLLVFPQNGLDIIRDGAGLTDAAGAGYLAAISGIGVEDVFYDVTTPRPPAEVDAATALLAEYRGGGARLVVSVDYVWDEAAPTSPANIARYEDYKTRAAAQGYLSYAGVSDLGLDEILAVAVGGGITMPQPVAGGTSVPLRIFGDLNLDNGVDATDAVILANYLVGNLAPGASPFTARQEAADVRFDATIDAVDAVLLANFLVGNVPCLPQ